MTNDNQKTLVNFRIESIALSAFDDACRLSGSTRTQILNRLIRSYTAEAAITMPKQIAEEQRSFKALRAAVQRAHERHRADERKSGQSTLRARSMKGFAEFIANDPIVGKRS